MTFFEVDPKMDKAVAANVTALNASAKAKAVTALRTANQKWHALLDIECGSLVERQFGMENGGFNASLDCKISRIQARIKELSEGDSFSFWNAK